MQGTDKVAELPNELILRIFANLDLQGLIAARCINQRWRTLVPFAEMGDIRRLMLDFYDTLLLSPTFYNTRDWVKTSLKPFDREAYIAKLLRQYPSLPEDFRLWVLEWPEKAVIAGLWPGLPRRKYTGESTDGMNVMVGTNWLSYPQVSVMVYIDYHNRVVEHIPGIVIWSGPEALTWLIVDERKSMNGKIFHYGMGSYRTLLEGSLDLNNLCHSYDKLSTSWIAYLRRLWDDIEHVAEERLIIDRPDDIDRNLPILTPPIHPDVSELAATAWKRRNEPVALNWLESVRWTHPFDTVA
ncbi:hypothetical protein CVT25_002855 [Psilocybe cyanescens]|uniref:F-box domain-containing protein n=1 Tax=Psilocybe cyanescens TaxID=93625 RepID=A0A409WL23_PSICY|nr:hypothetical protein CVT25_002855 [Psilocybe cyanescens]